MARGHHGSLFARLSGKGFDSWGFVRQPAGRSLRELVDAGVAAHIGAGPHGRTAGRRSRRSGRRPRTLTTQAGDVVVNLPRLREGSRFPQVPGTPPPDRPGPLRGGDDRLHQRHLDPQGRQAGQGPWARDMASPGPGSPGSAG